jgi:ribosomal protein L3 glutamine methyltransferase
MASQQARKRQVDSLVAGTESLTTVGDWLRFAVTTFSRSPIDFAQGLPGAQDEALFLVSCFLGLEQEDLPHFVAARLTPDEIARLQEMVRRRVDDRVPIAYLVNEAVLGGLRFFVDERVLIPRSYIGELLPEAVARFGGRQWAPKRILDLGTGSGCLAILAARAFPESIVDAVDLSAEALAVAAINVSAHRLDDRVNLLRSDLFGALPSEPYDLILANPPYEPAWLLEQQPAEIGHEPRLALDGGLDGMNCVRRIVGEARRHLTNRGLLVLELGGLRLELLDAFPGIRHHVFALRDGSDAVLGFRARALPTV